jgi:hypothetical protein
MPSLVGMLELRKIQQEVGASRFEEFSTKETSV